MRFAVDRPPRRSTAFMVVAAALSCSAAAVRAGGAQAVPCDASIEPSASDPWAYRVRGDRCEGTYTQPVAGTPLIVASFTSRFNAFDPAIADSLMLRWPAIASGDVRVRAIALRRRLYYRMDTEQPAAKGAWAWPTDLLSALELDREDLGIVAWTRQGEGDTQRDVHLPLRIGTGEADGDTGEYALVVVPQVELTEVYVSVSRRNADGSAAAWLRDEEPLGYGYYPADRPIEIPVSRPAAAGLYRIQIGARIRAGGSLASELWFQRPPG